MSDNDNIKEQIKALEKKFDTRIITIGKGHEGDIKDIDEQIAEMKEQMQTTITPYNYSEIETSLNNNINQITELKELHKHQTENDQIIHIEIYDMINSNIEILRDHIKSHKLKEEKGREVVVKGILLNTWLAHLNRSLKKLDSQGKTEKKEDSETLKKIKQLAHAESEFYNKHGYFSFWSDKLKAQRIKETVLLKHLKDHKKVSEDQRKGIDREILFNEFDKANDELIKNLETEKKDIYDYRGEYDCTKLEGLIASGSEKEKGTSIVADEDSPKIVPKESDLLDSKPPEPIDPCISCSDGDICEEQCELSKDSEKEYEKYAKAMREKEKLPETKFLCGNCGKQFESYHDEDGIQTRLCQKCHWDEFIGKLEAEPEKSDSININIYKNGLLKDSLAIKGEIFRKAKPEKSIGKSNSYYKGYEDCEKELTEKILKDLDELIAWSNNYPKDSEIYIRLKRKREEWGGG